MNQRNLRLWHRRVGIVVAPFLLLQGVSGLVLSYGIYSRVASVLTAEAPQPLRTVWNLLMAKMHFGPGLIGWVYHSLVGLGLLWMIGSGVWIWFDLWMKKRSEKPEE